MGPSPRAFLLLLLIAGTLGPTMAVDDGSSTLAGRHGVVRTVVGSDGVQDVPVRFIGTLEDWIGPGRDVHLIEMEGPVGEVVGVANGMSGSPVYVDGEVVGALAYRYGALPKRAVGGVTPIEDVFAAGEVATGGATPALRPIATPLAISGLVEPVRRWLQPWLEEVGLVAVAGGGSSSADPPAEPYPGMPVGVRLVGGDVTFAATGTVTWVDGEKLYAFGHPFLGEGRTELPMVHVEVAHTLADIAGSFRLTNVGRPFGAVVGDRLTGIVGKVGAEASVVPMTLDVRGAGFGERRFDFELARHPGLLPQLAAAAVANVLLRDVAFEDALTVRGRGEIRLDGLDDVPVALAFSGEGASNPVLALAGRLRSLLAVLHDNPFGGPTLTSIGLSLDFEWDRLEYRVEEVLYDREPVPAGGALDVECVLRGFRGERERRALSVAIPADIAPGTALVLAIGSDAWLRGAARSTTVERLGSARDLATLVRALSELPPDNRLEAVVYRSGSTLVSSGTVMDGLPATARRLLGGAGPSPPQAARVAEIGRFTVEMPGPVEGGVAFRFEVGPAEGEERK